MKSRYKNRSLLAGNGDSAYRGDRQVLRFWGLLPDGKSSLGG